MIDKSIAYSAVKEMNVEAKLVNFFYEAANLLGRTIPADIHQYPFRGSNLSASPSSICEDKARELLAQEIGRRIADLGSTIDLSAILTLAAQTAREAMERYDARDKAEAEHTEQRRIQALRDQAGAMSVTDVLGYCRERGIELSAIDDSEKIAVRPVSGLSEFLQVLINEKRDTLIAALRTQASERDLVAQV